MRTEGESALQPRPKHPACAKCGKDGAMKIKLGPSLHPKHPKFTETAKIVLNMPERGLVGTFSITHLCEDCHEQAD